MVIRFLEQVGGYFILLKKVFSRPEKPYVYYKQTMHEMVFLGLNSVGIISIISFFMGAVITLQTAYNTENPIYPTYLIGLGCRDSILLEFSSTIAGLILAGKVGSSIASEIGTMRVTEQIDAMEVSGTNPLGFVVTTRVMAAMITVPVLVIFADAFSLFGAFLAVNIFEDTSSTLFIDRSFSMLGFRDLMPATIKTVFFGFFLGLIGCYKGYNAGIGTESVGKAANSAVVSASLTIFVIDLVFVLITNLL